MVSRATAATELESTETGRSASTSPGPSVPAQRTVARPVRIHGIGLHLGRKVCVEIRPAEAEAGIVFVRSDLPESPAVTVGLENIQSHPRRTALVSGAAEVHTVEHLLAALWAVGIDAAEVRVDGPELPGLDGSAYRYFDELASAGTADLGVPRSPLVVREPAVVSTPSATLVALPESQGLRISYTLEYRHPALPAQHLSILVDEASFAREIAPARTFCLEEEARALRAAGLGRGANTQNTLVIGRDGAVIENQLRFPDEFVRHKILDLLGDLYLTRARISGHVVASRSGHELNVALARALVARRGRSLADFRGRSCESRWREGERGDELDERWRAAGARRNRSGQPYGFVGPLDASLIQELLPHAYPFLLLDRVLDITPDGRVLHALKNVTFNEPYFPGHFPGNPVMPGVLQVEAMAQAGGVLLLHHERYAGRKAYLLSVDQVKFRRRIVPGDQLIFEVVVKSMKERSARVDARALVDGSLVAEARIRFVLAD